MKEAKKKKIAVWIAAILFFGFFAVIWDVAYRLSPAEKNIPPDSAATSSAAVADSDQAAIKDVDAARDFCVGGAGIDPDKLAVAIVLPLNESRGGRDYFAQCANKESEGSVGLYHFSIDQGGQRRILWRADTAAIGLAVFGAISPIGDIDDDGVDEVSFYGGDSNNGECGRECGNTCIYAPSPKKFFCIATCAGWADGGTIAAESEKLDCPTVKIEPYREGDACAKGTYLTRCFNDASLKKPEYRIYRDYLTGNTLSGI